MQNTTSRGTTSKVISREACPQCVAEGRDTAEDNLAVYDDGHTYCYGGHGYLNNKKDHILDKFFTYEYLSWRGVSKETMSFYDVKTKIDDEGKPISLGFPYPNESYKVRLLDKKEFYTKGEINKAGLFGRDKFSAGAHKYVTITEGELDALSLHQALGNSPVVSVQSSSSAVRDCTVDRSFLNSYERIYLCFDADAPGRKAAEDVARLFDYNKVYFVRLSKRKDANEFVAAGESTELSKIWWNSKQFLPENIKSTFSEFEEELDKPRRKGIPYPFQTLTEMTDGIRLGETVLITAQEKVGKTELMHFIEHKILTETDENVGAIFLEENPQRHLQALAGIQLKSPIHLPGRDCPRSEIVNAIQEVIKKDGRLHIYSHFGSDDGEVFLDTIRFLATARNCKYILLDHISMVVSGILGGKGDDRKQLDYLSTRLEMMVKELNIALIMVSHVNDFGQTRGSRYLTKVADITINATRDLMSTDPIEKSTIRLSIPYSRYPGLTGEAGAIIFDRETYSFNEVVANDNTKPAEPFGLPSGVQGMAA